MVRLFTVIALGMMLAFSALALADQEIKFKDGTLIRGKVQGERLQIRTKFGTLQPKVDEVVFVSGGKIELSDGSQVWGELVPGAPQTAAEGATPAKGLRFQTKYGTWELIFRMDDVEYIDFRK